MSQGSAIGARGEFAGRTRTFGLSAFRRKQEFAVTTTELSALLTIDKPPSDLSSSDLLQAIPLSGIPELPSDERFTIAALARTEELLNVVVRRFHPHHGRIQGIVTALHGAVRFAASGTEVTVRDVVEVEFSASVEGDATAPPLLEPEDTGALITTWEGLVVGLLIGGSGRNGFVAPVGPFLAAMGLVHRPVQRDAGISLPGLGHLAVAQEAAIASQRVELQHEGSFGLEQYLEAA